MTKTKDIGILRTAHLRGPNIWTYRPVIEAWLDIGELEDFPSNLLPGLYERLTAWLPGLIEHRCGVGERGGFLERLREGTWSGHILEHVALELQNLAGMRTGFGKTRSTVDAGIYKMAFRTRDPQVGMAALEAGRELLMAAIEDRPFDLDASVRALQELVDRHCLGPSTAHIVEAATERRIPALRLTDGNLVQLGHGCNQRRIWTAETDRTSAIAESIAGDKDLTKTLLKSCGVPVPEGALVRSSQEAWEEAQDIGLPVVVKPYDGNHGRGVVLNLSTREDIEKAYHIAAAESDSTAIIVERYIPGDEHRLLVVGREVVAAAKGESLWVTGDGKSSVTQLCDSQINTDPRRGDTEDAPLGLVIPHDSDEIKLDLARQGLTPNSIPQAGQNVLIQVNGNVAHDCTERVHPSVAHAAALAARVVGLDIAGIDLVTPDVTRPLEEVGGAIIEVNASPGLLSHLKPATGAPRNVGSAIMAHLFAEGEDGRIPIVGITGSRGTALAARLAGHLLHLGGRHTGVACAQGLYLDGRQVSSRSARNWEDGQRLLINRTMQAAVFESDARLILTEGLAYDRCLVGVVTDLDGQSEVEDLYIRDEDAMYNVIRSQVDVVLPEGWAVLNAQDERVAELAGLSDGGVILYGVDAAQPRLLEHVAEGGRAVTLRGEKIVLLDGENETALVKLAALRPSTAQDPAAVLAAVAAAWALEVPAEIMCAGLRAFDGNGSGKAAQAQ